MKITAVLLVISAAANAATMIDVFKEEWSLFKVQFAKNYTGKIEESYRMKIFMDNKHKIAQHNKLYERGEVSFKMKMNHYGDLLHHEFSQMMFGYRETNFSKLVGANEGVTFIPPYNVTVPAVVDWRASGAVTPVKNQGQCGSCWAFSVTGSLEGQHFRKTGQLVSLSEQQLIDCSQKYGNHGCQGGSMDQTFRYIKDNGGIDTEGSYPYEAKNDRCRYNPTQSGATDKGAVDIPSGNEEQLKVAVATVGPISVAIDASRSSFQFYHSGVYYESKCSAINLDHGVLVVGYGTSPSGGDYWLVKNSWGANWGSAGFIQMARNRNNNCGIASAASYPLV